ncbi:hypothetical protein [Pseudomonas sp. NPDC089758]|uniref:hypothetical protein n=1 Tax=Pseudomonas sp. NPDC089758 TaxID=3364473 RepID=UPI00380177E5
MWKDQRLLDYYAGWPVYTQEKTIVHVDLKVLHKTHGLPESRRYYEALKEYGGKFKDSTFRAKKGSLVKIINVLCKLLPDSESLKLLQIPEYVNQIFDAARGVMEAEYEITNSERNNRRLFDKQWKAVRNEIYAFLIDKNLIAKPAYPITKGRVRAPASRAMEAQSRNELDTIGTFGVLTPVPLNIKDEKAASLLYEQISADFELVKEACEEARAEILCAYKYRLELAAAGRVCGSGDSMAARRKLENRCRTWQEYNYHVLDRVGRYRLYADHRGLNPELALLSNSTLLPFVYLLVAEHPAITNSWLHGFELYDKNGNFSGLQMDGAIADSIKPRRGPASAQQPIYLSPKAKILFNEILMLTKQARDYLKSVGNDHYRYLFLTANGIGEPMRRQNLIPPLSNEAYAKSLLRKIVMRKLEGRSDRKEFFNRITLKAMRTTAALKIYFETGRLRAMSDALGHKTLRLGLLSEYLPSQLMRFFLNRWIRIFETAITYKAVVGRPCMNEALGIQDEEQLAEFLKNHDLKALPPYLMVGKYGLPEINVTKVKVHSQVVFPITPDRCALILSMLEAARRIKLENGVLTETAEHWWRTGKYLEIASSLQDESGVHLHANEVVQIFKAARFSEPVVQVLIPVMKAA